MKYKLVLTHQVDTHPMRGNYDEVVGHLQLAGAIAQDQAKHALSSISNTEVVGDLWAHNQVHVETDDPSALYQIQQLPFIASIHPDIVITLPFQQGNTSVNSNPATWGVDFVNAQQVWALGFTGQGVRLCSLDTGVQYTHPALGGRMVTTNPSDNTHPGGWAEWDVNGVRIFNSTPYDSMPSVGHGTHTIGTMCGNSANGTAIGVAPGANFMSGLVLPNGNGSSTGTDAGIQWAMAPSSNSGVVSAPAHIISMSWGADNQYDSSEATLIQNVRNAGILVSIAAGNAFVGASSAPADCYAANAVGALDTNGSTASFSSGIKVAGSSFNPQIPGAPQFWINPHVSAPGVNVVSCVPQNTYASLSGTSMATPHVSGVMALIKSANPNLTAEQVYSILYDTALWDDRHRNDPDVDIRLGVHGRVNALLAVNKALSM